MYNTARNGHTTSSRRPGLGGFPTEFSKVFALTNKKNPDTGEVIFNPFAVLLSAAFRECVSLPEGLPDAMREAVISMIFKEKGQRYDLKMYRPIAVMSVLYKIMARTMADALQGALPYVVDTGQAGLPSSVLSRFLRTTDLYRMPCTTVNTTITWGGGGGGAPVLRSKKRLPAGAVGFPVERTA